MSMGLLRDIGAWIKGYLALIPATITAGAGNDGVEVDGPYFAVTADQGIGAHGGVLLICWSATLAQDATLTLSANMQDATDISGTGVADFGDALAATVVATGGTGGSTENGVTALKVKEINGNRGFMRAQVTADLSATGVDTVDIAAILVTGGAAELPSASGLQD